MIGTVSRLGVVLVAGALVVGGAPRAEAQNPAKAAFKCRNAVAGAVRSLAKSGLKAIAACHKQRDKGKLEGDCNDLSGNQAFTLAMNRASSKVGALCAEGNPALANYPGGNVNGITTALFPAVRDELEASAAAVLGSPELAGDKATLKRLIKCHTGLGAGHALVVNDVLKASGKCQKRLDKNASEFSAIAPSCVSTGDKGAGKATKKLNACNGIDPAQVGTCSTPPTCVVDEGRATGQLLARVSFGGAAACGNGTQDLGEECDDGNTADTDACTAVCKRNVCGDTIVNAGVEQCDDGNRSNEDACLTECQNASCGDGFLQVGVEECDDAIPTEGTVCQGCAIQPVLCGNDGAALVTVSVDYGANDNLDIPTGALRVSVDYPTFVAVPGSEDSPDVLAHVTDVSGLPPIVVRDIEAEGRLVVGYLSVTGGEIETGPLFTVRVADCPSGMAIRPSDFDCTVEEALDKDAQPLGEPVTCSVTRIDAAGALPTTTTSTSVTTSSVVAVTTTSTTIPSPNCGNGTTDAGETCDDGNTEDGDFCPSNCNIATCNNPQFGGPLLNVDVTVNASLGAGQQLGTVQVLFNYPEGLAIVPGSAADAQVTGSLTNLPGGASCSPNDLDYALNQSCFSISGFSPGLFFRAALARCEGAPLPSVGSFSCEVRDATDQNAAPLSGVTCSVSLP